MRRIALGVLALLLLGVGWLVYAYTDRPSLEAYANLTLRAEPSRAAGRRVTVTFLGVSTLLITDGETALMTDGFFTRPSLATTLVGATPPPARRWDAPRGRHSTTAWRECTPPPRRGGGDARSSRRRGAAPLVAESIASMSRHASCLHDHDPPARA